LWTAQNIARWTTAFAYQIDDTDAPLSSPIYPNPAVSNGSYHAAENPMLFSNSTFLPSVIPISQMSVNQQVLARQLKAHWTAFARTGDPTAISTPVWPQFDKQPQKLPGRTKPVKWALMSLQPAGDSHVTLADTVADDHNCDFWGTFWN
jgi:para-nitrobenzyl esterase